MAITLSMFPHGNIRRIVANVVAGADGSVPAVTLPSIEGFWLALMTVPGSPAPTPYNVQVIDQSGHDLLEGCGAGRSASSAERVLVHYAGLDIHPCFDDSDTLTLRVDNNSRPFAVTTLTLFYGYPSK